MKNLASILFLTSQVAFGASQFEGFFSPQEVSHFPVQSIEKSVFKLEIGPQMHGTGFAISPDVLITNVHNVTQCLRDHGYVESGYDGSKGPLECKTLNLRYADLSTPQSGRVRLLASNARYDNGGIDFAVIQISGLKAHPLRLSQSNLKSSEIAFVVGFPGQTFRSTQARMLQLENLKDVIDAIFGAESLLGSIDAKTKTSQAIFEVWQNEVFLKLQPLTSQSNFLSGSLIGNSWIPLLAWQSESSQNYLDNLKIHLELFKKDTFMLMKMIEQNLSIAQSNYPDADNSLKVSRAKFFRSAEAGVQILEGDATPGSSGSVVLDSSGMAVGIVFQIRGLNPEFREMCTLDAIMTDFESIHFNYCPAMGPAIVSSDAILRKLNQWQIKSYE